MLSSQETDVEGQRLGHKKAVSGSSQRGCGVGVVCVCVWLVRVWCVGELSVCVCVCVAG